MTRIVDRGATVAAYVGIGMAVTIAISFLLVIPIEPIYWLLAVPAGLLIGYYANQRSDRRTGPWSRIVANAAFAGLVTALTMAAFLLVVKALFFFGDGGSAVVAGVNGMCTAVHHYYSNGSFIVRVIIIGSSTSDRVTGSIPITVAPELET